ncbi:MAG: beta-galactosidase, partial [Myxococcota bacterium]|nr:beta-galactosidase [Myxococcota bacterium]
GFRRSPMRAPQDTLVRTSFRFVSGVLALPTLLFVFACGPLEDDLAVIPDQPGEVAPTLSDNRFGFLVHAPQEVGLTEKAGAAWIRLQQGPFIWNEIEPAPGKWDFSKTDQYVKLAQAAGLRILGTIYPYADWDQKSCHAASKCRNTSKDFGLDALPHWRCTPCDSDRAGAFVTKLVERYDGDGVNDMPGLKAPVDHWEVLNEPSLPEAFFIGDALGYLGILKRSQEAIRGACPSCVVVQGGVADKLDETSFWDDFFKNGGATYFDLATIHYIEEGDVATLNVAPFKALLKKHGVSKPIWVTEAQFKPGTVEVESAVKGALAAGADKIFFTGFEVGFIGSRDGKSVSKKLTDVIAKYK